MRKLRKGDSYGFCFRTKQRPYGYNYTPTDPRLVALPLALIYLVGHILWSMLKHILSRPYSRLSLTILISIFCCCAANGQEGRTVNSETQPMLIGRRLPASFWTKEHLFFSNGDTIRKSLAEYKGKVIIFDFWATWCGACFQTMPKMQSLQDAFGDNFQVILVNPLANDKDLEKLTTVYTVFQAKSGVSLPTVVLDEYLLNCFPHMGVPHYFWINPKGHFIASSRNSFVDAAQVAKVISGKF